MTATKTIGSLITQATTGSLGTLTNDGTPLVTLVSVAPYAPTELVMLLSGLAKHTVNLKANTACSLLLVQTLSEPAENPMTLARVSLAGRALAMPRGEDVAYRDSFLSRHPESAMYADFADFAFYRFEVDEAHLVAGFGRIETVAAESL